MSLTGCTIKQNNFGIASALWYFGFQRHEIFSEVTQQSSGYMKRVNETSACCHDWAKMNEKLLLTHD